MTLASRRSVLGMLAASPAIASGRAEAAPEATALREYDRYVARLAEDDQFSGVILVTHRDRPVLARAYGMADKERSIPNRIDTRFNLASASKPFTALAIVQLAEQGKLMFSDRLGTHLDGFRPEVADQVTIHNLLTHTSGLGQPPPRDTEPTNSREEEWERVTTSVRQAGLDFIPGTRNAYSSSGLNTLGEIVATVSKQPFWDYVHEHIFEPARMRHSKYYTRDEWLTDPAIAHPYMYQADGTRIDAVRNLDAGAVLGGGPGSNAARAWIGAGGGGGFSTAPDLVSFARTLRQNKLLGQAFTRVYVTPKFPVTPRSGGGAVEPGNAPFQAYGLVAPVVDGQQVVGHGGGIGGGNTNWSIYLDTDWVGVILCNYDLRNFEEIIAAERRAITASA